MIRVPAAALLLAPALLIGQEPFVAVDPTPVLRIGETTGSGEAYIFTDIGAIDVLGDTIFVLAVDAKEVRLFDHSGRFLGRIGRPGTGPGEFELPTRMRVGPDGVEVVDPRLRRRTYFSFEGDLIRTEPLRQPGGMMLSDIVPVAGGWSIGETAVFMSSREGSHPTRHVVAIGPGGEPIDTLAGYSVGAIPFRVDGRFGFLEETTGVGGDWALAGDSALVVVSGHPPVLRRWAIAPEGLHPRGHVRIPIEPVPLARAEERTLLQQENERRRRDGQDPLPRTTELETAEYWGQVRDLVVSDDGRCWIQWNRPHGEDDGHWFVVDPETGELSRATLPSGFRLLAAAEGHLYGYRLTTLDVPLIHVFRLSTDR